MRPNTNIYARNIISTDELLLSDTHKQEYKYKMGDLAGYVRYMPQVITVAKSGWRFNRIQDALDSINDANYIIYGIHVSVPAIYFGTAKNVKLMNVWSNRALGANITNLIADGFHVDSNVEI